MRLSFLAVVAVMLGVITSATEAFAAGNVLLPSDSSSTPSLGLVPDTPKDTTTKTPELPNAGPVEKPAAMPDESPDTTSTLPQALPFTPVPQSMEPKTGAVAGAGSIPTTVIKQPDLSTMVVPDMPQLPPNLSAKDAKALSDAMNSLKTANSLNVGLEAKSIWGPSDLAAVTDHLGIPAAQVPAQCRISVSGILLTNTQPYVFDAGSASQAVARYNGAITNVRIHIRALCNLVPLPPNKGVVIQIGEKYVVELGGLECPAPTSVPRTLAVLYTGGNTGRCDYQ